ncbi:MAG: transposase [Ignavibacteriae bacterium]|nr:transposase [Ignavibacteriota bacterium]
MKYNPQIHHRRSIRLKGYDYSQAGAYFITICTKERECLMGEIMDGEMIFNDMGRIADEYLQNIPNHFSHVEIGEYVVMPNHVHCILVLGDKLDGGTGHVGTRHGVSLPTDTSQSHGVLQPQQQTKINQYGKPVAGSVSVIVNQYKSSVKRWCNNHGHENFQWQSRFYEHIIRNEQSYQTISNYIINNPANWNDDKLFNK